MTEKGSYEVSDVRPSKDGSFRSMICAMLIFLAICVIIILVSTLLKPTTTKLNEKYSLAKSSGEETKTYPKNETTTTEITKTSTHGKITTPEIVRTNPTIFETSTQGQTATPKVTIYSTQTQTTTTEKTQTSTQEETTKSEITETGPSSTQGQTTTPETTKTSLLGQTTSPEITKTETTTLKTSTQRQTTTPEVTKTSTQTQTTTPKITQTSTQEEITTPKITGTEPSSTQEQTTPKTTKTFSTVGQTITPEITKTETTTLKTSTQGQTITPEVTKTSTQGQTTTHKVTKTSTQTQTTTSEITETEPSLTQQTFTPKIIKTSTVGQTITPETTITSTLGLATTPETTITSTLGQITTPETIKTSTLGQTTTTETTKTSTQATTPEAKSYTTMPSAPEGESLGSENENLSSEELIDDNICTTPTCKTFSSQILAQMNHHVDKCDGFYDYTCGGFQLESTEEKIWRKIGEQVENITIDSSLNLRLFKDYYDMCLNHHILRMNDKLIDEAKNILHSIIPNTLSTTNEDITKLLATLMLNDYAPLFDISVDISKETKLFEFQLTLGRESTLLENENYVSQSQKKCMLDMKGNIASLEKVNFNYEYKLYRKCMNNGDEYINNVVQTVKDFDLLKDKTDFKSKFTRFINEFMDLPPFEQRTELIMKNYELKSISELNAEYPFINWDQLFSHLIGREVDVKVQVYFGTFLKYWFKHLNTIPKNDLADILHAMFANNLYRTFVLPTTTSILETEKLCLKQTSKLLKEVSSSMYLDAIKDLDIEPRINEMNDILSILKDTFKKSLETAKWLPEDSKVFEKLDNMKLITNMAIWTNESIIEGRMDINPSNIKTYQSFSFELVRRYRRMIYKMWNEPADNPEYIWWFYQTVYSEEFVPIYALNKIVISPVKLLEVPRNIPEYIRLTKLYYLLAKAMGHHFDHTGIKYDVNLDMDSQIAYEQLKDCSSRKISQDQTITFNGKILEYEVANSLTLLSINNRIAEDIALKLIYDLSVKHLLFGKKMVWLSSTFKPIDITFITIAQEHCKKLSIEDIIIQLFESEEVPAPILLKIILPNLQTFEEVYKCPDGSTMDDYELCPAFQYLEKPEEKK